MSPSHSAIDLMLWHQRCVLRNENEMKTIHSVTKTMNPVVYCLDIWNAIFVPLRPSSFLSFSIRFTCSCVNIFTNPHNWHLAIKVSKSNLCCVILCIDGNKETVSIFCILGFLFVVFVSAIFKRFAHIDDTHETCPMKLSKYVEYYKKKWFKKIMWRSFRLHVDSSGLTDAITIHIPESIQHHIVFDRMLKWEACLMKNSSVVNSKSERFALKSSGSKLCNN